MAIDCLDILRIFETHPANIYLLGYAVILYIDLQYAKNVHMHDFYIASRCNRKG